MFRVTQQQMLRLSQQHAARQNVDLLHRQGQVSSGQRIQRPSDDPVGQTVVLRQQALVARLEAKSTNIAAIRARLTTVYQSVTEAHDLMVRAKSLTLQARQETDPQAIEVLAQEVDSLLSQLRTVANANVQGAAVFGGADLDGPSFAGAGTSEWAYQGGNLPGMARLDGETWVQVHPVGSDVFGPVSSLPPVFVGSTGAAVGAGVTTIRGTRNLTVEHSLTTFAMGAGLQPGSDTAADTILGPTGANVLTIDDLSGTGAAGTIALNGGPAVAFTSSDTNLVVTGPLGEIVHIDTTAITPGFSGTVDLTATGTLSIDGGASSTPLTFAADQMVVDSTDGSVLHIDSTDVRRIGTELVDGASSADAFQVLAELRDELRNVRQVSPSDRDAALARRLDDLDRIADHLRGVLGEQSTSLERLEGVESRTEQMLLDARGRLAETSETDLPEAILALQSEQLQLQFSLATATQLLNVSVLNFLR